MDESNISSSSDKLCPNRTNSTRKLLSKLLRHKSRSRSVPPPINNSPPLQRKSFEEPSENYLILKTKNIQGKKCRRNSGPPIPSQDFSIKHGFFTNSSANLSFIDSFFKDNCSSSKDGPAGGSTKSELYSGAKIRAEDKVTKVFRRGNPKNGIAGALQSCRKIGMPSSSSVSDLDQSKLIHSKAMRSKSDHNVRDYVSAAKCSSEKSSRTSSSASLTSFKLSTPDKNKPQCDHKDCSGKHCLCDENQLASSVDLQDEGNKKIEVDTDKTSVKGKDRSIVVRSEVSDMNPSMDSLAKQALLAAKVFNLIPTNKARERNYLHGRIAAMSLMGPLELEKVLPCREVTIFVGTWNMNGQAPPKEMNDFLLPEALEHVPDLVAVGTQESYPERFEWEVSLQETLGPSHVLLHSASFGTLHLAVFIRRDLLWFCSVAEDASMSTRPGTAFRTKGAIAIGFLLFGTSFLFLTSHLTAHTERFKDRINDIRRITTSIDLPKLLPLRHKSRGLLYCPFMHAG
ncbi:hypothetical protein J437_LFUL008561 [Ladona fulva]|uniref:Inositol polyphosphate-related phosphatase domain-containing protein n=1 Tax=Ladona fulva TaxID=123851 RepID=A0A8K0P2E9_LADFU|nr:hypothetical protein J437_LFUL008561 [Ladona fulva]